MINPLEVYLVHETRSKTGVTLQPIKKQIMGTGVDETGKTIYLLDTVWEGSDDWGYYFLRCDDWTDKVYTFEECIRECEAKAEILRQHPRRKLPVIVSKEAI